jgi:hypothetical protein
MLILPHWPDFPWDEVEEADRGFDTECWVWTRPLPPTGTTINVRKQAKRLFNTAVGERDLDNNEVWMHICERYGEVNLCVRPDHIRVGTKSENALHAQALRAAAGVDFVAPMQGKSHSPETLSKMRGRHERARSEGPYVCEQCGREFKIPATLTTHVRHQCRRITDPDNSQGYHSRQADGGQR